METVQKKWQAILKYVRTESGMSDIAFNTWLIPLKVHDVNENVVYIIAPNELTIQYLNRKLLTFLGVAIAEIMERQYEIEFVTESSLPKLGKRKTEEGTAKRANGIYLNPKYTFENFVVGDNNRFAHASALAVAEMPGEAYNPLYIHGGAGLGKTHLIQAIGNYILERNPEKKIIYVTSEAFTHEVIEVIRSGTKTDMSNLREKYRNCDVLMVDDIQFLIGKESTQSEFFHTFNELHLNGKQIIITSDRPPREFTTLSERMVSRYTCGLMADVGLPSYEVRMAILKKIANDRKINIDQTVLAYIATHFKSNIRELEGALTRLEAYAHLTEKAITLETAEQELAYYIAPDEKKEITPQVIIETVAEHYHLSVEDIISKKRNAYIVKPRQVAMYLCNTMTKISLDLIGSSMGRRDHTTVIYGCRRIEEEMQKNEQLAETIEVIKKKISPN